MVGHIPTLFHTTHISSHVSSSSTQSRHNSTETRKRNYNKYNTITTLKFTSIPYDNKITQPVMPTEKHSKTQATQRRQNGSLAPTAHTIATPKASLYAPKSLTHYTPFSFPIPPIKKTIPLYSSIITKQNFKQT
jgi:hypothetical protein